MPLRAPTGAGDAACAKVAPNADAEREQQGDERKGKRDFLHRFLDRSGRGVTGPVRPGRKAYHRSATGRMPRSWPASHPLASRDKRQVRRQGPATSAERSAGLRASYPRRPETRATLPRRTTGAEPGARHGSQLFRRRVRLSRRGARLALRHLPPELRDKVVRYESLTKDELIRWHKILAAKGWIAPAWPQEWGGTGWNAVRRYIFEEECGYAGAPPLVPFGLAMCGPVLLEFGTPAQTAAIPAADLPWRRLLVPGLFGAQLGLGPRVAAHLRRAPGRSLRRQRAEDVDHDGAHGRLDLLPRPYRHRKASRSSRKAFRSC